MKPKPTISYLKSDIFENIGDYDSVIFSIEAINSSDDIIRKLEKHYQSKFYFPKDVYPKLGEITYLHLRDSSYPKPVPYIFSFDLDYFINKSGFTSLFNSITLSLNENTKKIGIQLPSIKITREITDLFDEIFEKNYIGINLSFHCNSFFKTETPTEESPSLFISYDHKVDNEFFIKLSESIRGYKIRADESNRFNARELENTIQNSVCLISLLTENSAKELWFRREIETALFLKKPVIIIKKAHDNIEIPTEFKSRVNLINFGKEDIVEIINQVQKTPIIIKDHANYWWLTSPSPNQINLPELFSNYSKNVNPRVSEGDKAIICSGENHEICSLIEFKSNLEGSDFGRLKYSEDKSFKSKTLYSEFVSNYTFEILNNSKIGDVISLDKEEFDNIYKHLFEGQETTTSGVSHFINIAGFNNDAIKENSIDQLGITFDVQALARLIAFDKLQPPLSIALFGNWGSGKSFFMAKLKEEIKSISEKAINIDIPVCKGIAHIEFNAWHYMDANLWASLVFHIFNELNMVCGNITPDQKKEIDLYKNLVSWEELTKEAGIKKAEAENNYISLKNELDSLIQEKAEKEKEFKLTFSDTVDITSNIITSNQEITDLVNELGVSKITMLTVGQSKKIVEDFSSTLHVLFAAVKGSLRSGKNIWIIILILLASTGLCLLLINYLNIHSQWLKKIVQYGLSSFVLIGSWYNQVIAPQFKKVQGAANKLKAINQAVEAKKEESLHELKSEIEKIDLILKSSAIVLQEKRRDLANAEQNLKNIQSEIDDYKYSKLLAGYIQQRLESDDYKKQLGIISMIRNDFESLSKLLTSTENNQKSKPFQRIVLYIDDLDRCPEERVVQVLEAIHLLLAFPLFVVVVGVDPRWVSNALKKKYPKSLMEGLSFGENKLNNSATTLDYLEKIFQLPILLKPVNENGSRMLIESLLSSDVIKNENPSQISSNPEIRPKEDMGSKKIDDNRPITDFKKESNLTERPQDQTLEIQKTEESYKRLNISQEEIDFIKNISPLIGETPRAIKRFINTYRLVRSHENFTVAANNINSLKAIIIFLSLANSHEAGLRKIVNNWAEDANLILKSDFNEFEAINKELINSNDLFENRNYIQAVLRYSFYYEG